MPTFSISCCNFRAAIVLNVVQGDGQRTRGRWWLWIGGVWKVCNGAVV